MLDLITGWGSKHLRMGLQRDNSRRGSFLADEVDYVGVCVWFIRYSHYVDYLLLVKRVDYVGVCVATLATCTWFATCAT